ncbi:MAG TPA: 1-deoxy-D-xylulose-5-phosphate synthase [Firmicutes bacterium]|nr:1-deoxy-D-xylulose-5-phosphate synthase [Bacillota bacterium]
MGKLLAKIKGPEDLPSLTVAELVELAAEIRKTIIDVVARNGGHLAPNLGVVELTLALHSVLNSPRDKIIWDVGHQCYVHKLLTGRQEQFPTLRTAGGLSGFPKPEESPHDVVGTGHTSTSISSALGLALARDLKGEDYTVCAVIGDGALTGGLALEGLNHAGHVGTDLLVVLNDNEMSISPNVGALSSYLSRLRADPAYGKLKADVEYILRKIPAIGGQVVKSVERVKDSLKYLLVAGVVFEELGFTYLGPIDGHNIPRLKQVLTSALKVKGPVLVHVITTKGKGYPPAEAEPDRFHGIGPFDPATGKAKKKKAHPSYTEVFAETLVKLAERDHRIVGITAAMPMGTGLDRLARQFPNRCFDVGIAEQHAVTLAAGLATGGLKPVVAIYSTFLQRAYDQIVHDICLANLPVVFAIDRGGVVGEDGPTHHGVFDLAYLRSLPGMTLMAPKDEAELQQMLVTALGHRGPIALRYPRGAGEGARLWENPAPLPIGKAEVVRPGSDLTLLALGPMVARALAAAEILARDGIDAAVVNARFVKPLDEETILAYAQRTGKLVTIEDHVCQGGFGSAVLELLAQKGVTGCRVVMMGYGDQFIEHGSREYLLEKYKLTAAGIVETVRCEFDLPARREPVGQGQGRGKEHG